MASEQLMQIHMSEQHVKSFIQLPNFVCLGQFAVRSPHHIYNTTRFIMIDQTIISKKLCIGVWLIARELLNIHRFCFPRLSFHSSFLSHKMWSLEARLLCWRQVANSQMITIVDVHNGPLFTLIKLRALQVWSTLQEPVALDQSLHFIIHLNFFLGITRKTFS